MARPFTTHFVPYTIAKDIVNKAGIQSRAQYHKWYSETKPKYLPRHPENAYGKYRGGVWTSWNDFLGTSNSFEKTMLRNMGLKKKLRPFWESVRFAQSTAKQFDIRSEKEWYKWCDDHKDVLPDDVPKRPSDHYDEFVGVGWKVWLGKNVDAKIETAKQNIALFGIHNLPDKPPNVIVTVIHKGGYSEMERKFEHGVIGGGKLFVWDNEKRSDVDNVISHMCRKQGDGSYIVPNVHALIWELSNILLLYKREE